MQRLLAIWIIALLPLGLFAQSEPATKDDIKTVLLQMDKRFEQVDKRFEQVDKRFEQMQRTMDERFAQMNERFEFMQNLLYVILAAALGSPFLAEYFARRRDQEIKEEHDRVTKLIFVLKNLAKDDPKIKESLQIAGIL